MITLLNVFILILESVLTLSFLPHLRIMGVVPLFPLFFIIQLAYFRRGFEPLILAAASGIMFDLYSPYPFGFYLGLFLLTAAAVRYFFGEGMRSLSFWHYLILTAVTVAVYLTGQTAFLMTSGIKLNLTSIPPYIYGIMVNLAVAAILYPAQVRYFDWLPQLEHSLKRR